MEPLNRASRTILRTYITLTLMTTFSWSLIWGINTLFLLDAGLSVTEAFAANAFFTAGQVLFEVPTGVVADTVGRRPSFLWGTAVLFVGTMLYLLLWQVRGPFWAWAGASMVLGLGFTFFSGATEAWLVDGLKAAGYRGSLDAAFAKGEVAGGIAMLTGTIAGGVIAQFSSLGVPYALRAAMLVLTFVVATLLMHDVGFKGRPRSSVSRELRAITRTAVEQGFGNPPVRWMILAAPFVSGVGYYGFYAMQPYLLELYGDSKSYAIAGLAAAVVACAQIAGGLLVPHIRKAFRRRTELLLVASISASGVLALIGLSPGFVMVLILLSFWAVLDSASYPVRQAFINALIPSAQRATVLSADNLLSSSGGIVAQPLLGRVADVWGYAPSYLAGAGVSLLAVPFILLARREKAPSDIIDGDGKAG